MAQRSNVPVVPLALATDAWASGSLVKDFGKIDNSKTVRFSFGAPIRIQGRGSDENQQVIRFIGDKLAGWQQPSGGDRLPAGS